MGKFKMFAVALMLAGCCDSKGYPSEAREEFVAGCVGGKTSVDFCECAFDSLRERYNYAEYRRIAKNMGTGKPVPSEAKEIILGCYKKHS